MKRVLCASLLAAAVAGLAGCHDSPIAVCPAVLYLKPTLPDTTTIRVGAATIAIAGAAWGGCETGPPIQDVTWIASDSNIVRVTTLDSIHASIEGLRPGVARVTPVYVHDTTGPSLPPVVVTVVP